jgi:N-acetylglucosamine-6-phosphate deacetylase
VTGAPPLALVHATVHTGDAVLGDRAVVIEDGVVAGLEPELDAASFAGDVIDLSGHLLAPGLIDLQVNGGGDRLFNDAPSVETLAAIACAHERFGTTDFMATYLTGPAEGLRSAGLAVQAAHAAGEAVGLAGVLGVHFEGPLLNPTHRGVHDLAGLAPRADGQLLDDLAGPAGSVPTLVTLAPEMAPPGFVGALARRGAVVSAGHTGATPAEVRRAVEEGLRGGTHVWNAMPPVQARRPGPVAALLSDPRTWCSFIADGHHLSPETLALSLARKPRRSILVSDAMPPVGGSKASFELSGARVTVSGDGCLTGEGRLAGGAVPLLAAVRYCVSELGVQLDEALRMATLYPAQFLGVADRRGRIAVGHPARIVALRPDLSPSLVVVGGRVRRLPSGPP